MNEGICTVSWNSAVALLPLHSLPTLPSSPPWAGLGQTALLTSCSLVSSAHLLKLCEGKSVRHLLDDLLDYMSVSITVTFQTHPDHQGPVCVRSHSVRYIMWHWG